MLIFDGHFSVPRLSALTRRVMITPLLTSDPEAAVKEANEIVALDPQNADSWTTLGKALQAAKQTQEAHTAFEHAIGVAQTVEPEFQQEKIPSIRKMMGE